jgi:hypothetical protein
MSKEIDRFNNVINALAQDKNDSPYSEEAWQQQDKLIVQYANGLKNIRRVCQTQRITGQDIVELCDEALKND